MTIGGRIRKLRESLNMNQTEIVNNINDKYGTKINGAMWSKWENDKDTPSMDNLRIIAKYFDTTLDYLSGMIEEDEKPREHPSAMFKREGLKVLFSAAEDLDDESLEFLKNMANKLKGK